MRKIAASLIATIGLNACMATAPDMAEEAENDMVIVTGSRASVAQLAYGGAIYPPPEPQITERYEDVDPNPVKLTAKEPVSTFSSDVDTTSYSVMRRYISRNNELPPSDSVRVEEFVNYFDYQYNEPQSADAPFSPTVWVTPTPWNAHTKLMHIGVKGFDLQPEETPDTNIVLLLDVSGSMQAENKLPLVKKSVELLVNEMSKDDTIAWSSMRARRASCWSQRRETKKQK